MGRGRPRGWKLPLVDKPCGECGTTLCSVPRVRRYCGPCRVEVRRRVEREGYAKRHDTSLGGEGDYERGRRDVTYEILRFIQGNGRDHEGKP